MTCGCALLCVCVCVCVCVCACVCVLSTKEAKEFQEGSQGWGEHTQEGALLPTAMGTGQGVPIYGCEQGSLTVSQPDQVSAVVLYAITGQTQSTAGEPERACVARWPKCLVGVLESTCLLGSFFSCF